MLKRHLTIAFSKEVMMIAFKVALIVGTILALINHGPKILNGTLSQENVYQILITYLVPYCVSTYSSMKMFQKIKDEKYDLDDKS
jgi:hypothetical protein